MAPNGKLKIVRRWQHLAGPTGESGRYQTEDGTVWKERGYSANRIDDYRTGDERGVVDGGYIIIK